MQAKLSKRNGLVGGILTACLCVTNCLLAVDRPPATDAAKQQISALRHPEGLKVELFAESPQLGSPVAIGLDEQGRVYVAEEYRFNRGTEENRTRPFLLEDDLQINTIEDRLKMFQKYADRFEGGMDWFTKYSDQIRLLTDTDGDGRADRSTVFAAGFNSPLDGLAAGVLARDGDVYVTCIPDLWLLRDKDGDGVADTRKSLLRGFGVNAGFLGHDLHGMCWGPDGKLYFSVGDRGFHVETYEKTTLSGPRNGAVFRCDGDGHNLEVVHTGLRNPQELAFDNYGNLFAADNNCDKGDHSRLVYIVEGGHSGWNMAYQSMPDPYLTGPWHAEGLWHLGFPGQAAYIVPPVGKLGAGPSGFCFYPGTGLSERYQNHFFLCNYTGNGGIEAIGVKPRGASFEITDQHDFLKPIFATDAEFGYDGKMYVSDFVALDWNGESKGGRIFTIHDPQAITRLEEKQVNRLFREGFSKRWIEDLLDLLSHPDQRVRQRAQFELASRDVRTIPRLAEVAQKGANQLGRLHAIWALGQMRIGQSDIENVLQTLLTDSDSEVRAQAAKVLGQRHYGIANQKLVELLRDPEPRVRFFAAQSLGRNVSKLAFGPLVELLRENRDADPYLRHAAVTALGRLNARRSVQGLQSDPSPSVRLAALLIQRKQADPQISNFLQDADQGLVVEAARAINDLPIESETPKLAALLSTIDPATVPQPLLRRVLNANFRLGEAAHAQAVLAVVVNPRVPSEMRAEALQMLKEWTEPGQRDRVNGFWRPLAKRQPEIIAAVLKESAMPLLTHTTGKLQIDAMEIITRLNIPIETETFLGWLNEQDRDVEQRVAALNLLVAKKDDRVAALLDAALKDAQPLLRAAARQLVAAADPARGVTLLAAAWKDSSTTRIEKQRALRLLADLKNEAADKVLQQAAEDLVAQRISAELRVDVIEAASERGTPELQKVIADYRASLPQDANGLAWYRAALQGGDAANGMRIFRSHTIAQCFRCHRIQGQGGDAGPDLSQLAGRANREHMLESMIDPNAKLAPGFGTVSCLLTDGRIVAGVLKGEDAKQVSVLTADGITETIEVRFIEERTTAKSAMPPVGPVLKLSEIRDVIEYLSTLR